MHREAHGLLADEIIEVSEGSYQAKNPDSISYRDANLGEVIIGVDPDPVNNERTIAGA